MRKRTKPVPDDGEADKVVPAAPPPPNAESRLGGVRAVTHDEDERPSREDRTYGETIFTRPAVPLPRILRRGRRDR